MARNNLKIALLIISCLTLTSIFPKRSFSAPAQTLKVGAVYGLTGPVANLSEQYRNGAILAKEALEQKNIINLKIFFEDSQWQAKTAVAAYRKLVELDKVKIIHITGSQPTLAVKPISEREGILLFSAGGHKD